MKTRQSLSLYFVVGFLLGAVIACSPTKFNQATSAEDLCDGSVISCQVSSQSVDITQQFKIGSGKVDILFVNDNSASMSEIQKQLASKFAGFIQNLDSKSIDYRIAVTTTDLNSVRQKRLVQFSNGKYFLTNSDSNRVQLFNQAIVRGETITCESFIINMFNTYGTYFQTHQDYLNNYSKLCPSSDTRGIYTARLVVSENAHSLIRSDASLNIIVISNDNVRQGQVLEESDKASSFISMMQQNYSSKYWDFNSIVVKDNNCKQLQTLRNSQGVVVTNPYGPALSGGIGLEYSKISNSSSTDIEGKPRLRGQYLDICESNYSNHFDSMATQISDEARMITLKCTPQEAPILSTLNGAAVPPHTWSSNKIIFNRGYEGTQVKLSYTCFTGPR